MNIETADLRNLKDSMKFSSNEILKASFKDSKRLTEFRLQSTISRVCRVSRGLWIVVNKLLIPFPFIYLVERGFCTAADLITKKGIRLDIVKRGDLSSSHKHRTQREKIGSEASSTPIPPLIIKILYYYYQF